MIRVGLLILIWLFFVTPQSIADSINPGIFSKLHRHMAFRIATGEPDGGSGLCQYRYQNIQGTLIPSINVALNQEGPVWFLPDVLQGREERFCNIPASKAILIPILTGQCDYGIKEVKSDDDLRRCAMAGDEHGVIEASIDGVKVKNLLQYRTQSGFFNITIPADNIYQAPAGTFKSMADGYFVFLQPLSPGNHDVHLKVSVLNPVEPLYNYNADWTYHLIVED